MVQWRAMSRIERNPKTSAILEGVRVLGTIEGISFLVLMLFAMPMKYVYGQPVYVKYAGWAHGLLFIALGLQTLWAWKAKVFPFRTAFWVMVAALLPAGPFFMDRKLRKVNEMREG
jgi:integral membrane protein